MKKVIAAILSVILCGSLFAGCSAQTGSLQPESGDIVCGELLNKLLKVGGTICDKTYAYGEKDFATYFEYWFDMPMQFVTDGAIATVAAGDNADEISVLYPQSNITYDTVKKALEKRSKRRAKDFKNLFDDQAERAENAVVVESGGYLLFVIADNPEPIIDAFEEITAGE